jgi:SH3-like domain-containing protein
VNFSRALLCCLGCCFASLLVSCSDKPRPVSALGEAYAGPSTLNLRSELALKSPVSATVKHGDKLAIVEYRRRLVKVRTAQGAEGWTDMRQLLTPEQMAALRGMSLDAARAQSQGQATVFESLNMHTEPSRTSPSFGQIPENGKVDVIGHKLTPRVQKDDGPAPVQVKPAPIRKKPKPSAATAKLKPPPRPPAPKLPENWAALSVTKSEPAPAPGASPAAAPGAATSTPAASASAASASAASASAASAPVASRPAASAPAPAAPAPPPEVPMDDWNLVRTADGKVGWVLTRPLSMAIPDEVAQYAEGHRITSYFPLGQVHDDGQVKNNWLWTTIAKGGQPYEFDSFRVFVWSLRHHRYETAYIERNIVGHYPVRVIDSGPLPSFSVVLEGVDGHLYRKTYSFDSYRIRMVNRELYDPAAKPDTNTRIASNTPPPGSEAKSSWYAQLKDRFHRLFR